MSFLNSLFQAIKFPKTNGSEWSWKWLIQIFVHLLCVSEKNDMKIVSNYWRFQQNMQPLQKCLKLSQVSRSSHSEGAIHSCTIKPVLTKICKVHMKTPVPECLFKKVTGLEKETPGQVFSCESCEIFHEGLFLRNTREQLFLYVSVYSNVIFFPE